MDKVETGFLQTQTFKPLAWLRYIDAMFFIWIHGQGNLMSFMKDFNNFKSYLIFTFECYRNKYFLY